MTIAKRLMQPKLHSFRDRVAGRLIQKITPTPTTPPDGTTIANTPNLALWYKADAMGTNYQSGADVTTWADSSGNGNTLYNHAQAGFADAWVNPWGSFLNLTDYVIPKWYSNQVNGKPLVRFSCIKSPQSGSEWSALSSQIEAPQSSASGIAMFVVYRRITDQSWETAGTPVELWERAWMGVRSGGNGEKNIYFRLHAAFGSNWAAWCGLYVHPLWAVWAGTMNPDAKILRGYKNGVLGTQASCPAFYDFGRPRLSMISGYMTMVDIAEVVVYGRGISETEVVNISNELKTKYAIT